MLNERKTTMTQNKDFLNRAVSMRLAALRAEKDGSEKLAAACRAQALKLDRMAKLAKFGIVILS